MTNDENERIVELSELYIESLQGYDGRSIYQGLPRHIAQEYANLRAKRNAELKAELAAAYTKAVEERTAHKFVLAADIKNE